MSDKKNKAHHFWVRLSFYLNIYNQKFLQYFSNQISIVILHFRIFYKKNL